MFKPVHPLRDLALKIETMVREHEAYSQAHGVVQNCVSHLSAIARTYEANAQIVEIKERKSEIN